MRQRRGEEQSEAMSEGDKHRWRRAREKERRGQSEATGEGEDGKHCREECGGIVLLACGLFLISSERPPHGVAFAIQLVDASAWSPIQSK